MKENTVLLRERLRKVGLSDPVIDAAWPMWWSDDADESTSAQVELRFSLARKLGLEPNSLLSEDEEPRFIWREEARFKHLSNEGEMERFAITSFGAALGRYLVASTSAAMATIPSREPAGLREAILRHHPFVALVDVLSVCWSYGIPVVHLRVFPCERKRMAAMSVRVGTQSAILVGKDSLYPPHIAFYLAHELAHISLGHLSEEPVIVDLDSTELASRNEDPEEFAADRFALELLTGNSDPLVLPKPGAYNAKELARVALESSSQVGIEPGTLALCFAYSTGDWATANAAMGAIYSRPVPVWTEINKIAMNQLDLGLIPDDARDYLRVVLGGMGLV